MRGSFFAPATLLAFLLLFASTSLGEALDIPVQEFSLANGLKVLLVERHDMPVFTAYITVGVGSVHETSEERGVAHLLEHMLFKGTSTIGTVDYGREFPLLQRIEEVGSSLDAARQARNPDPVIIAQLEGELKQLQVDHRKLVVKDEYSRIYSSNGGTGFNAFTSNDLTTYQISLPSNKLELWATLESDRFRSPVLREFYTERDVVREERRRTSESDPQRMLYEALFSTAFRVHPYRDPIIGWGSDIETLSLAETRSFLRKYYAPVNTVIALIGDLDPQEVQQTVERFFGDLPSGIRVPEVTVIEPPQKGVRSSHVEFDAEPRLALAFHRPTLPDRDDYVFDVIDQLLTVGRTSRLHRALVIEKQVAIMASSSSGPGSRYPNLFCLSSMPRQPHRVSEVEEAIWEELERIKNELVPVEELEKVKNRLRADNLRHIRSNDGLARSLTYYYSVAGDWRYLTGYDQMIATITPDEIARVARDYLTKENMTRVTVGRWRDVQ